MNDTFCYEKNDSDLIVHVDRFRKLKIVSHMQCQYVISCQPTSHRQV